MMAVGFTMSGTVEPARSRIQRFRILEESRLVKTVSVARTARAVAEACGTDHSLGSALFRRGDIPKKVAAARY
jgi:hypothetical protein